MRSKTSVVQKQPPAVGIIETVRTTRQRRFNVHTSLMYLTIDNYEIHFLSTVCIHTCTCTCNIIFLHIQMYMYMYVIAITCIYMYMCIVHVCVYVYIQHQSITNSCLFL